MQRTGRSAGGVEEEPGRVERESGVGVRWSGSHAAAPRHSLDTGRDGHIFGVAWRGDDTAGGLLGSL